MSGIDTVYLEAIENALGRECTMNEPIPQTIRRILSEREEWRNKWNIENCRLTDSQRRILALEYELAGLKFRVRFLETALELENKTTRIDAAIELAAEVCDQLKQRYIAQSKETYEYVLGDWEERNVQRSRGAAKCARTIRTMLKKEDV